MNHFQTERNFEEGKMKDDMMNEIQQKNEKSFPANSSKYLKNYLLYHTWTEFLLTFSSKFIFFFTNLKLLPRTIKIFEVEITVLPRIFIFSFYFLSHFIPLYFDQRGSQPNSMEKPSF